MLLLKLATRNIFRNVSRTVLTVFLISTSLIALVFMDGFATAMASAMSKSATRLFPGDSQIHQRNFLEEYNQTKVIQVPNIIADLQAEELIQSATPRTLSSGTISSSSNMIAAQIIGVHSLFEPTVSKLKLTVIEGDYLSEELSDNTTGNKKTNKHSNKSEILIGQKMAERLEVGLGDRIVISMPQADGKDFVQELFKVTGIFSFKSKQMDSAMVFIHINRAQQMLGLNNNTYHEIAFNFKNNTDATNLELPIFAKYSNRQIIAQSWTQIMPELASILELMTVSIVAIGFLLFILVGLGVVNALFMSIFERTYEFGVCRSIGTSARFIFVQIMAEALMIAMISAVIGCFVGWCLNYYFSIYGIDYGQLEMSGATLSEPIKTQVNLSQFTIYPLQMILLTLLVCIYPAWSAAKIQPAQALRKSL
ncbi:MAG: ABC transporter permease [Saccharospirillaceae bacterium]|nr:FtsX-like permease family protein [Pseudomonadales bacterium]NRB79248.1 ABC transporter permease [Saccharospirillaceae bacterium]